MKKYAVLTSATGGGGGIAAKRVYIAIKNSLSENESIELIDIETLGGALPYDVTPHQGGSNKKFSDTHYTVEFPGFSREEVISKLGKYDALNIHWCSYLITITELTRLANKGVRIVFTCHDFYYIFGGCHYPHTCSKWMNGCVKCPQIDVSKFPEYDSSHDYTLKSSLLSHPNVYVTAPSQHVISRAEQSCPNLIGKTSVIKNPISDRSEFNSIGRYSREHNKIKLLVIADSAHERRKAFSLACESILVADEILKPSGISVHVTFVGQGADSFQSILTSRGIECINHGKLEMNEIANVYKSTDAVFTPSLEDNWPNVLVEGLACGTLAVCGPGHGCEEFVTRYKSGIVAATYSPHSFAEAIKRLHTDFLDATSVQHIDYPKFHEDHSAKNASKKYLNIFNEEQLLS